MVVWVIESAVPAPPALVALMYRVYEVLADRLVKIKVVPRDLMAVYVLPSVEYS